MVWSGAVAAITLIGLAAIPFSLSAQGTAARVTIASSEPTAQPEAIALPVSSGPVAGNVAQDSNDPFGGPSASAGKVQNAKASAVLESSDDPFANGDSGPSTTRVPNQKPPAPPKPTPWQVQGPVPSWLDSELDQEELKVANEIRSKLAKTKLKVDFNGVPLSAVVNEIAEAIGIDVFLEQRSLTDFGISMEEPITLQFKNPMTARDALSLITHRLELSYTIRNGFIVIAYQDTQRDPLRTYDLSYVLPDNSTVHELMGVIRSSVHPEVWDTGGGMATLGVFGSMLVVRANEEAHQDLERLLRELARQNKSHIQPTPQAPNQSAGPMGSSGLGFGGGMGGGMF
jgi:hypothetical protein